MRLNRKLTIVMLIVCIENLNLFSADLSQAVVLDPLSDVIDKKKSKSAKKATEPASLAIDSNPIVVHQPSIDDVGGSKLVAPQDLSANLDGVGMMQEVLGQDNSKPINPPSNSIGYKTHLGKATTDEIIVLLEQDHEDNVKDLIKYRWCFRKCANFTEAFGNSLLYIGSGLATIAGGVKLVGSEEVSNIILFISTVCFASHVTLIGVAKCSGREAGERENQLEKLANAVNFQVTDLKPKIEDAKESV